MKKTFPREIFQLILLLLLVTIVGAACAAGQPPTVLSPQTTPVPAGWWQPVPGAKWQIQYEGQLELIEGVEVYDLDLFETDISTIDQLHAQGAKVICYFSAGTLEDWAPDFEQFPPKLIGKEYSDWPGETWLDISQLDLLLPVLEARIELCRQKGFDAIDPDNLDAWQNDTGFELTRDDALAFAKALAALAHENGLAVGLKNNPDLLASLVDLFDFMVVEEAFEQGWSEELLPFLTTGKAVFAVEYTRQEAIQDAACQAEVSQKFSVVFKTKSLDAATRYCH